MFDEFLADLRIAAGALFKKDSDGVPSQNILLVFAAIFLPIGAALGAVIGGQPLFWLLFVVPIALVTPAARAILAWHLVKHHGHRRKENSIIVAAHWGVAMSALGLLDISANYHTVPTGQKYLTGIAVVYLGVILLLTITTALLPPRCKRAA